MYFFDKKTEYLIWKMQEGQARGVGTVRFLVMDEVCRMEITITGCGKVQGTYPVYALSGHMQSLLGELVLNKGKGSLAVKCKAGALGHQAFPYTQLTGIRIDLKTEGCLEQKWLPVQGQLIEKKTGAEKEERMRSTESGFAKKEETDDREEIHNSSNVKENNTHYKEKKSETVQSEKEVEKEEPVKKNTDRQAQNVADSLNAKRKQPQKGKEAKERSGVVKPPEKEEFQLYTNKWQQLCAIYPVVHPFGDGRAYLSVEPRDFVVLQERYQPMVQNSFLLHGFYHYRHLLLGRQKNGKNTQYYLGVPGVFYEKEKSAALFYGFESFEGAVMPAAEGSFGYYMKRVQI